MANTLKFKKIVAGCWYAQDETKRYEVSQYKTDKGANRWGLVVRNLNKTAGIKHAIGQEPIDQDGDHETKAYAVAVAQAYSDLGDDYSPDEIFGASRLSAAVRHVY